MLTLRFFTRLSLRLCEVPLLIYTVSGKKGATGGGHFEHHFLVTHCPYADLLTNLMLKCAN